MNNMKENEKRLLNKWAEVKDVIFGLYQPFITDFYDYDHTEGYKYNHEKAEKLIAAIMADCSNTNQDYYAIMPNFIELCLMYIFIACNTDDWVYASLLKLSKTIYYDPSYGSEFKSTFDFMVEDEVETLSQAFGSYFFELYDKILDAVKTTDFDGFPKYVKSNIEKHIDNNSLNCLYDDSQTDDVLHFMDDFSSKIKWYYHRRKRGL